MTPKNTNESIQLRASKEKRYVEFQWLRIEVRSMSERLYSSQQHIKLSRHAPEWPNLRELQRTMLFAHQRHQQENHSTHVIYDPTLLNELTECFSVV